MRSFVVLTLLAVARAEGGGYNYGTGSGDSNGENSLSGSSFSLGSLTTGSSNGNGGSNSNYNNYAPENTEFNKEFFTYTAPETDFEDTRGVNDLAATLRKNLRVVFIRAPENKGLENAALQLAKQSAEQQTAIYVLTKQGDLSSLANKLQQLNHQSHSKPEVHFVKYRTGEDALNAQRTIQQEYESLGGSSHSHQGGVAPVLDFTSSRQTSNSGSAINRGAGEAAATVEVEAPPTSYLPPASAPVAPSTNYLPIKKVT